jgi:uncharacterized membrane protein YfcA
MKLSLKQKAFAQTLGLIVFACIVGAITGTVLSMIPPEWAPYILVAVFFGFCFYIMYGINVSRLEYRETLKKMTEKKG